MNTLEKLIAKLCPDGVEYRPLGKLGDFFSGMSGVSDKWADQGNCRFIEYMNVYENNRIDVTRLANATVKSMNQASLRKGDVLFTAASEVPEECAIAGEIEDDICEDVFADDHLFGLRPKANSGVASGYLKYAFQSPDFKAQVKRYVRGVTRFYVAKQDFAKAEIPIPPILVQKEIVRMLDEMAGLIDALEEELAARKKQYEYYRETLVGCDNNVPNEPIVSISECIQKIENVKWNGNDKTYHYIELSSIDNDTHRVGETVTIDAGTAPSRAQQIVQKDDVLFGTTRPLLRRYCIIPEVLDGQICSTGFCVLRANIDKVLPSWLYYVISTNAFIRQVGRLQRGGGYPAIANSDLCSCKILLPSFAEQKQIVKALNYLDTLCNSMTEGLPGEIALRKQQYEYYRDKLLAFKRAG